MQDGLYFVDVGMSINTVKIYFTLRIERLPSVGAKDGVSHTHINFQLIQSTVLLVTPTQINIKSYRD